MTNDQQKDPPEASPADVAEQETLANPLANPLDEAADEAPSEMPDRPVDEADWLDQNRAVPLDDEPDLPDSE